MTCLTALPWEEHGFCLHEGDFKDVLTLAALELCWGVLGPDKADRGVCARRPRRWHRMLGSSQVRPELEEAISRQHYLVVRKKLNNTPCYNVVVNGTQGG